MAMKPETSAGVVAPPPLIFLTGLVTGIAFEIFVSDTDVPAAIRWPAGIVLVLAGAALNASFLREFVRFDTRPEPWQPSTALVTSGAYRFSRNPGYLGMALIYAGIALLAGTLWPFATLIPTLAAIQHGVILREERYLTRIFGDEFVAYTKRVRRWI